MPGDPSAVDPFTGVLRALAAGDAGLPDACRHLLDPWGLDALALLEGPPSQVGACISGGAGGWPPGTPAPAAPAAGEGVPQELGETAGEAGPWGRFLKAGGCRRAWIVPLNAGKPLPALLAARAASRPLKASARAGLSRLAAALSLARSRPRPAEAGEAGLLLDLGRRLGRATDLPALAGEVEAALDRVLSWEAVVLVAGGPIPAVMARGGRNLGRPAREGLEDKLAEAARAAGLGWGGLAWGESLPPPGSPVPAAVEPLVFPLMAGSGTGGLLAVLPSGPTPGEGQLRLVAAVAQQAALSLDRWLQDARREERRLAALLEPVPVGVTLVEGDSGVRPLNQAARRMLATLRGEPADRGPGGTQLPVPAPMPAPAAGTEFSCRADQRTYLARWSAPLDPAHPEIRALILSDVTESRGRREQEMKAEKMLALGEMLSGVAHELNNPLASVVGFSQLLLSQAHEEKTRRRLTIIAEEAQRARRIVHNLLDVARARAPARAPVDLEELVNGILSLFAHQFRLENIQVDWAPPPGLPPVLGDRHQLQQVLVNLISNAQHALRSARGERRLRVQADTAGGRVRLQLSDTGPGIPPAHLDRIFDPFFTTKEQGVGTGLGLAIAARILQEHGGAIHARSEPAAGAVFTLDLPAGEVEVPARRPEAAPQRPVQGGRVLVVEDEDAFRLLLEEALEQQNYHVTTAADGAAALELLAAAEFDAVVSDLRMPVMDGLQLFQQIQDRRPELADRFVFMTGDLLDQGTRTFLEECGAPCLPKPFGLEELHRALRRLASR